MKHIIILLLLIVITPALIAQTIPNPTSVDVGSLSDAQIQKIIDEMQSRGLSMEQAIALAKAQGASQAQIDQLTVRISQLGAGGTGTTGGTAAGQETKYATKDQITPKKEVEVSEKTKKIFGYQIFNSKNLTFEPDVNIPISKNYTLGIGDQLSINVWGASQQRYQLTIDKSGTINIPDVGPVNLRGVSFEAGKSLIKGRLMEIYNGMTGEFPNTWAEVTLVGGRSIKIVVIGEINTPGSYTLPANAAAFNALYLSGGPNENGSFREIKLIRDGDTIKTIDVYDFLLNGNPSSNVQLREQDILFVPNYKTRVEIAGHVKHPGYFEIKEKEKLSHLLRFAGGFTDLAYSRAITVIRKNDREREVKSITASDFDRFSLQNGDSVRVDSILNRFSNRVAINGAVFHPGNYELTPGMKLSNLIKSADGLREDAFMNRGLISRRNSDNTLTTISFDVKEVADGLNDPMLQKEDHVMIRSLFDMREAQTVRIFGEVAKPDTIRYHDNMTLGDLIFSAGGLKEIADLSVVEVSRRLSYEEAAKVSNKINQLFKFSLDRDLKLSAADAAFHLKPFDEVYVRRSPGSNNQGTFTITGEVYYTGTYVITSKTERISDAIQRAGGLIPGAFLKGATLQRTIQLSEAEIQKKKLLMRTDSTIKADDFLKTKIAVGIELEKILTTPGSSIDLLLQPGDEIFVPRELQTIKVSGNVRNPLALTYEKRLSLKKYINMAGGYDERSKKKDLYVLYANGTTAATHGFIFKWRPKIAPGSEIIVPRKSEPKGDTAMKWVSIASALSSLALTVVTIVTLTK